MRQFFAWKKITSSGVSPFHLFPTLDLPPKVTCSLIRPFWTSFNKITASIELFIKNLFCWWSPHFITFEPPSNNPLPKNIYLANFNKTWKTSLHSIFHFRKNSYFWWLSNFSHIKTSLHEPQKVKGNFKKTREVSLNSIDKQSLLFSLNQTIKPFYPYRFWTWISQPRKENLWSHSVTTR